MWLPWALSAVAAALTVIPAKIGVAGVPSTIGDRSAPCALVAESGDLRRGDRKNRPGWVLATTSPRCADGR